MAHNRVEGSAAAAEIRGLIAETAVDVNLRRWSPI